MKNIPPEDRPALGQLVNDARAQIEKQLEEKQTSLAKKALDDYEKQPLSELELKQEQKEDD